MTITKKYRRQPKKISCIYVRFSYVYLREPAQNEVIHVFAIEGSHQGL